jgi:hypothetical protein
MSNKRKLTVMSNKRKLECSECGATTDAACDCRAPYVPAGTRAARAIAANPWKSNRALATECGIDEKMIRLARKKSGAEHSAPEKRIGKDGKKYPVKPRRRVGGSEDEGQRQFTALVLRLVLMIQGQVPQRYAKTGAAPDDLKSVARFVSQVAAAKAANSVQMKAAAG